MKNVFEKESFLIIILVMIPFVSFAYFLPDFIFPKAVHYSDYTISHYPNLYYLKESVFTHHTIPLWNTQILSGFPNIANPLSGLWYPGNWLTILFPLPLGSHLVTIIHLLSGGIGMYLYLRQRGSIPYAAFIGALAFELMPKLFVHYAAGHISLVQAITWTPWILLFQQKRFGLSIQSPRFWYQTAIFYGLILLCDLRWVFYMVMIDGAFFLMMLRQVKLGGYRLMLLHLAGWCSQIIVGMFLSAIFLLPFYEYLTLTDRIHLSADDISSYGLPIAKLMGFIIPDMGGYAEYMIYPGLLIWVSFLGTFSIRALRKKLGWLYALIGFCLLLSFISALSWMGWIENIPGVNLLRVPSRLFFVIHILFVIMTAAYLTRLELAEDLKKTVNLLPTFFTFTFSFALLMLVYLTGAVIVADFIWPVLVSMLLFVLFLIKKYFSWGRVLVCIGLVFFAIVDFMVVNTSQLDMVSAQVVLSEDGPLYEFLSEDTDDLYRVYSPSYRLEQQLASYHHVQLVDGIDPLHLQSYTEFMEKASGVPYIQYGVTIPAYGTGNPKTDNIQAIPDSILLGLLNTRYVISDFPIRTSRLTPIETDIDAYIYKNEDYLPRAWIEMEDEQNTTAVELINWGVNEIQLKAKGPGTLVLSEINYPGWQATLNGQTTEIMTKHQILRSVELPDAEVNVNFFYQPVSLYLGALLTLGTMLILLILEGKSRQHGVRK
jgi:hypothetical protein